MYKIQAHGVPKSVPEEALNKKMFYVDATCPLVTKVHREAELLHNKGYNVILIGHKGHPEVLGTMGQLPEGSIKLIETVKDAQNLNYSEPKQPIAYVTQTTLSVDDTKEIVDALKLKFDKTHALSVRLNGTILVLGLGLLWITAGSLKF